ncbi:SHOCT domain-containing protein [Anaerovorax odorimutans]|uniref:SHOCT domain-containing protein n=1 Tax=Anaerovorax odorimutans TaxID=109327 RepID=A0ABT1RPM1_9FIRM|nr:SHOCT domain-containing protein [Anaerovorax odorimutans]MCQ4637144.1 SHOCT domain-containing protein [Anaerovorax odorimutans]
MAANRSIEETNTVKVIQTSSADEIRKYKELMDDGIISQEEFEAKKKELLGL